MDGYHQKNNYQIMRIGYYVKFKKNRIMSHVLFTMEETLKRNQTSFGLTVKVEQNMKLMKS